VVRSFLTFHNKRKKKKENLPKTNCSEEDLFEEQKKDKKRGTVVKEQY
jgi:hypothetical protein